MSSPAVTSAPVGTAISSGATVTHDVETFARARVERLNRDYAEASAEEVLRVALTDAFKGRIALVSSFGAEAAVLLSLVSKVAPDTPVVFLDTGKHFAQTLSYRNAVKKKLGLTNIQSIKPLAEDLANEDPDGELWRRDTNACCDIRKVRPLSNALGDFDAWITGRKQFHGGDRMRLPFFEWDGRHFKVNPLARWSKEQVASYFESEDLPRHPLVDQGFLSIGCWPCTHPVADDDDPRAGRWAGTGKTECGIHTAR